MKERVINAMIPKKTFQKGSLDSMDRFLIVVGLRKKTLNLILSILENDFILNYDSQDVEEDINKTYINFLKQLLSTLIEYHIILLIIEVYYTNITDVEAIRVIHEASFWSQILATGQYIENIINLIKEDSFGVKFKYDNLRSMIKSISDSLSNILEEAKRYPIVTYEKKGFEFCYELFLTLQV
jgi:hypothetical protein